MLDAFMTILGTAVLGIFGWAFHLGNRVSILEVEKDGLKELIEQRFDGVDRRLDRIERGMNGHLPKD